MKSKRAQQGNIVILAVIILAFITIGVVTNWRISNFYELLGYAFYGIIGLAVIFGIISLASNLYHGGKKKIAISIAIVSIIAPVLVYGGIKSDEAWKEHQEKTSPRTVISECWSVINKTEETLKKELQKNMEEQQYQISIIEKDLISEIERYTSTPYGKDMEARNILRIKEVDAYLARLENDHQSLEKALQETDHTKLQMKLIQENEAGVASAKMIVNNYQSYIRSLQIGNRPLSYRSTEEIIKKYHLQ